MKKQKQEELLKMVEKNYNEIAVDYGETRRKKIWPVLEEILKNIKNESKVLDVGCGSAKILNVLKDKKVDYLGIDKCDKLLKLAKNDFNNFNFAKGDILELGKVDGLNYDYVFCVAVLHHLPGADLRLKALRQLKNKVAEDGRVIISVWALLEQQKYRKLIWKFWLLKLLGKNKMDFGDILFEWIGTKRIMSKRYYHAFRMGELKKLCKKAGFKIEEDYNDKFSYYLVLTV